jgi:hypothetical protein
MGYPHCNETGAIDGCGKCIYGHNNSLAVYSSPDLSSGSWKLTDAVYTNPAGYTKGGWPACTYFRSQAVYNPKTKMYVMWANVAGCDRNTCPKEAFSAYAVGTSAEPGGPYKFVGMTQPSASSLGPSHNGFIGDEALLVDDDGAGYIILTRGIAGAGHRDMYIFRLTPDFIQIDSTISTGPLPGPNLVEAPAIFKREEKYYALLGGCSCMGLYGGGVAALTAKHPLGPCESLPVTAVCCARHCCLPPPIFALCPALPCLPCSLSLSLPRCAACALPPAASSSLHVLCSLSLLGAERCSD